MAVNVLNTYNIDIFKLSNSVHEYDFKVDSAFFEAFENSEVTEGTADALVTLDKSDTMIQTTFEIKGSVILTCDRSLEQYEYPLDFNNKIIFKYGDDWEELSEEIITIPRNEQRLNMAQYIYEFIGLALPMKKLHPKFESEETDSEEEDEWVYSSDQTEDKEEAQEAIDPRWAKLKDIKK